MEKKKTPPFVWVLLTALSLSCYVYLHATAVEQFGTCPSAISEMRAAQCEKETNVVLPNIALVKKIFNITKIVMPSE